MGWIRRRSVFAFSWIDRLVQMAKEAIGFTRQMHPDCGEVEILIFTSQRRSLNPGNLLGITKLEAEMGFVSRFFLGLWILSSVQDSPSFLF